MKYYSFGNTVKIKDWFRRDLEEAGACLKWDENRGFLGNNSIFSSTVQHSPGRLGPAADVAMAANHGL